MQQQAKNANKYRSTGDGNAVAGGVRRLIRRRGHQGGLDGGWFPAGRLIGASFYPVALGSKAA